MAVRAGPPEADRFVFLAAVTAEGDRRDDIDLQFTAFQQVFLVGGPAPAVGEQVRYDCRYLADVHHHAGYMSDMVLLG